jgi:hypothetical protein
MFLAQCEIDQVWHPNKTTGKIIFPYILILHFWIANWKTRDSGPKGNRQSSSPTCSYFLYEYK